MQGAILAQQPGVGKAPGSGQHGEQKGRQGYGRFDLVGRSETERHVLPNLVNEVQLLKKNHKHGHTAERRYRARSLAQNHTLIPEQRLDLTRD